MKGRLRGASKDYQLSSTSHNTYLELSGFNAHDSANTLIISARVRGQRVL